MKTQFGTKFSIWLIGLSALLMLSFIPAKYAPDFKKDKKQIDTLTIFSSFAHIVANNNVTAYADPSLAIANQKVMDSLILDLLDRKYILESQNLPQINPDQFADLFAQLEQSPKTLNNISSRELLENLNTPCKNKYALLLVYHGQYHPDFPPHYKFNSAVQYNTIAITPNNPTKSTSDLRLLVIDTEQEEVVFYDEINSSKYDPRVKSEVEQMTRNMLKKIYNK
jgi:hypothetical protein